MSEPPASQCLKDVFSAQSLLLDDVVLLGELVNKLRTMATSIEFRNLMQDELHFPVVDLERLRKEKVKEIIGFPVKALFRKFVTSCQAIPILVDEEYVLVLASNPFDQAMFDATNLIFGKEIKVAVVDGAQLKNFFSLLHPTSDENSVG